MNLSYGIEIVENILSVGTNFKIVQSRIEQESTNNIYTSDFGVIYKLSKIRIGLTTQNVTFNKPKFKMQEENVPLLIKLGSAVSLLNDKMLLSIDISQPTDANLKLNMGSEYVLTEFCVVRAGYKFTGTDYNGFSNLTLGLGLKLMHISLDYVLTPYGDLGVTQQVSLIINFGGKYIGWGKGKGDGTVLQQGYTKPESGKQQYKSKEETVPTPPATDTTTTLPDISLEPVILTGPTNSENVTNSTSTSTTVYDTTGTINVTNNDSDINVNNNNINDIEKKDKMQKWFIQGQNYLQNGNYQEAIKCFEEVLKLQPGHELSLRNIDRAKLKIEEKK